VKRPRRRFFTGNRALSDAACEANLAHLTSAEYAAHTAKCDAIAAEMRRMNRAAFEQFQLQECAQ
jgi:hypothetical protein